jgi:hypothetical protein
LPGTVERYPRSQSISSLPTIRLYFTHSPPMRTMPFSFGKLSGMRWSGIEVLSDVVVAVTSVWPRMFASTPNEQLLRLKSVCVSTMSAAQTRCSFAVARLKRSSVAADIVISTGVS